MKSTTKVGESCANSGVDSSSFFYPGMLSKYSWAPFESGSLLRIGYWYENLQTEFYLVFALKDITLNLDGIVEIYSNHLSDFDNRGKSGLQIQTQILSKLME